MPLHRVTVFVVHDENPADYEWVLRWLERWRSEARMVDYSSGGWEHSWDVEAPELAVAEVPERMLCTSKWATWPRAWPEAGV